MTRRSALVGLAALGLCAAVRPGDAPLLFGLALGFAFSLVRFQFSCGNLVAAVDMPAPQAQSYLVKRRLLLYGLTGAVMALAFWRRELFNPWATAGGIFLSTVVVIGDAFLGRRPGPDAEPTVERP